jgi:hypothetical protein
MQRRAVGAITDNRRQSDCRATPRDDSRAASATVCRAGRSAINSKRSARCSNCEFCTAKASALRRRYESEVSGGAPFDAPDSGRQCERRLKRGSVAVGQFLTTEPKFFDKCFLCKQSFQFGPHLYDGRHIASWGISICHSCDAANWDGVVPNSHPDLIEHLKQ